MFIIFARIAEKCCFFAQFGWITKLTMRVIRAIIGVCKWAIIMDEDFFEAVKATFVFGESLIEMADPVLEKRDGLGGGEASVVLRSCIVG